jgi:hypothetical protein
MDINCRGSSTLAFPATLPGKAYPDLGNDSSQTVKTVTLDDFGPIEPPYGLETLILLSTVDKLTDVHALEFKGAQRGQLPSWGVEKIAFRIVPKENGAEKSR